MDCDCGHSIDQHVYSGCVAKRDDDPSPCGCNSKASDIFTYIEVQSFRQTEQYEALVARVESLIPTGCYVTHSEDSTCFDFIGATFPSTYIWTEDMCCLPCRLRAVLAGTSSQGNPDSHEWLGMDR